MPPGKFGIEAEYALIKADGTFCDYTNTRYNELAALIEKLPDHSHPELKVGRRGIRVKNWYVEGDGRFNDAGELTEMVPKGIEIRTPALPDLNATLESLRDLRAILQSVIEPAGYRLTTIAFNPVTKEYAPEYSAWEREYHSTHPEYALSEISTLSYGPDLNFSFNEWNTDEVVNAVRRLTYYSPYLVPFSFNSPFHNGALWDGLSYRTYHGTGGRPAALAHINESDGEPYARKPSVPAQYKRIEFKAFDMVADDELVKELFHLILGVALAQEAYMPEKADIPDAGMHKLAAMKGFDNDQIRDEAARAVDVAHRTFDELGTSVGFPLLSRMLETRRTPAHLLREVYQRSGLLYYPLA